jgi:hypothetical protein
MLYKVIQRELPGVVTGIIVVTIIALVMPVGAIKATIEVIALATLAKILLAI